MPLTDQYSKILLNFNNDAVTDSIGNTIWHGITQYIRINTQEFKLYSNNSIIDLSSYSKSGFGSCLVCTNMRYESNGNNDLLYSVNEFSEQPNITLLGGKSFTVDFWLQCQRNFSNERIIIFSIKDGNNPSFGGSTDYIKLSIVDDTIFCTFGDIEEIYYGVIPIEEWTHITIIYNYYEDSIYLYVNTNLIGAIYYNKRMNANSPFKTSSLVYYIIGDYNHSNANNNPYMFFIDDFHVSDGCCRWLNIINIETINIPLEPWGSGTTTVPILDESIYTPVDYIHYYKNGIVHNIPLFNSELIEGHSIAIRKNANTVLYANLINDTPNTLTSLKTSDIKTIINGTKFALCEE